MEALETGALPVEIAGAKIKELDKEKNELQSIIASIKEKEKHFLSEDMIKAYLLNNKQAIADRDNMLICKKLIDDFVERIIISPDEVHCKLKFDSFGLNGSPKAHLTLSETTTRKLLYAKYR